MKHFFTQAELTNAVVVATTTFPSLLLGLIGVVWLAVGKLIIAALDLGRTVLGANHSGGCAGSARTRG